MGALSRTGAGRWLSWVAVLLALFCAALPLVLSGVYAVTRNGSFTLEGFSALTELDPAFVRALTLTVAVTVGTVAGMLVTLLPVLIVVHVWRPGWRPIVETICTLPLVVPSIALAAGFVSVLRWGAQQGRGTVPNAISQALQNPDLPILLIGAYTMLCLPFAYRSLDAGLRALPLSTFFEASASLGGGSLRTLLKIVVPSLRRPMLYSSFFALSLAFGEFTIAATLNQHTLPVWLFMTSSQDFRGSIALTLASTLLTWLLLVVATVAAAPRASRARPAGGVSLPAGRAPSTPSTAAPAAPADTRKDALV